MTLIAPIAENNKLNVLKYGVSQYKVLGGKNENFNAAVFPLKNHFQSRLIIINSYNKKNLYNPYLLILVIKKTIQYRVGADRAHSC